MPFTTEDLDELKSRFMTITDGLQACRPEIAYTVGRTVMNSLDIVRPDWSKSMKQKVLTKRPPILYTSHFEIDHEVLSREDQPKLYVALTYLGEFCTLYDLVCHAHGENRFLYYPRLHELSTHDLPLVLLAFVALAQESQEGLTPEQLFLLDMASSDVGESIRRSREGRPPGL